MRILVQQQAFDFGAEVNEFASNHSDMGAIVTFCGVVRDVAQGGLDHMLIEHYEGMTLKALQKIAADAQTRWNLGDVQIIHRFGALRPGEMIMMVATAATHRKDAFEAAEFLMDYLKSRAPFWKKEMTADGSEWVAAKVADEDALKRW